VTRLPRNAAGVASPLLLLACTVAPYEPRAIDPELLRTPSPSSTAAGATSTAAGDGGQGTATGTQVAEIDVAATPVPAPTGPLELATVLRAVGERYPPYLSALLERDLASGRLTQALGGFDANLTAKLGNQLQGYYEATTLQTLLEQPLATGDTIYGGYRISDGFLPDYDKDRTQDDGQFVLGGRVPLLRDRGFDRRRAGVKQARIEQQLAEPVIQRARIDFVRAASRAYWSWVAAGQRLAVAEELLLLAEQRVEGLQRGVDRRFVAPIDVVDNERLIAQRRLFVVRAERQLQQAALELSLYWRDTTDAPIVPVRDNLPKTPTEPRAATTSVGGDTEAALRQRPELRRLQQLTDRVEVDLELARNQALPNLDLVIEATHSPANSPYGDIDRSGLFVGGELKWPLWRRDALGRVEQALTQQSRLQLESRFARDRIVNEVADAHSALTAAIGQLDNSRKNRELAAQMVDAERRAFELGRSDLLRVQLREIQLADARVAEVEAQLAGWVATVDLRAALGVDGAPTPVGP
jgi:outer membrane protein TolC